MQTRIGPLGGLGPLIPPVRPEIGIRPGPDLVPVVTCGVNAQGRRFVMVSVRNEGTAPAPRLFTVNYTINGRGFISGQVPVTSLRPGQQLLLESTDDNVLQGINPITTVVVVDSAMRIPEDINPANNRMIFRCPAMPIVSAGPLGM